MQVDDHPRPERSPLLQAVGNPAPVRPGLLEDVRYRSVAALNRLLAHAFAIRDLYMKARWKTSGSTFHELHLLLEQHHGEQGSLADSLAMRIRELGGKARELAQEIAAGARLARAPESVEPAVRHLRRLVDAHELILVEAPPLARTAEHLGDEATHHLIVNRLIRSNETQRRFLLQHLQIRKVSG